MAMSCVFSWLEVLSILNFAPVLSTALFDGTSNLEEIHSCSQCAQVENIFSSLQVSQISEIPKFWFCIQLAFLMLS
jgi:hypothetical protein